ncbi:MAG: hypothetical protein WCD53_15525, partial [Microcoleus sp.]
IDSAMGEWVIDKPFKHQDLGGFIPQSLSLRIPVSLDRGVSMIVLEKLQSAPRTLCNGFMPTTSVS